MKLNMKRAVVTGPTGAIGVALINELISHGIEVSAICHKNSKRIKNIPASDLVDIVEYDLSELADCCRLAKDKYDVFYHLGWAGTYGDSRNDIDIQLKNIEYTIDAVELAARIGCKKFVGAGSQAEYGRTEERLNSETAVFPENGYGMAKLCAGQMSRLRCNQLGMEHIWTRILSVYGPYDGEKTLISNLIKKLLSGKSPECTKGEQIWDYMYSKDAARALRLLGESGENNKTYCIGSGTGRPLREYIEMVGTVISKNVPIHFGAVPYAPNQVMHLCADITELIRDTGFEPIYSFEEGIKETIEWMRNNHEEG